MSQLTVGGNQDQISNITTSKTDDNKGNGLTDSFKQKRLHAKGKQEGPVRKFRGGAFNLSRI